VMAIKPTVIAYDAGGATILASLVARNGIDCNFVLGGPAVKIFESRLDRTITSMELEQALNVSSEVLTGTGWSSDLEFVGICSAKEKGIFSRSFLDHWVNYEPRFTRGGVTCLPDEIVVGDEYALVIAREVFSDARVTFEKNPYFEDVREFAGEIHSANLEDEETVRVLYVAEPIRLGRGFTEWDRVDVFLELLQEAEGEDFSVTIRPHPSEEASKYENYQRRYPFVQPSSPSSLLSQIASHHVVVGCETMAMAVAVHLGKPVFTAIPEENLPCSIPLPGILPLPDSGISFIAKVKSQ